MLNVFYMCNSYIWINVILDLFCKPCSRMFFKIQGFVIYYHFWNMYHINTNWGWPGGHFLSKWAFFCNVDKILCLSQSLRETMIWAHSQVSLCVFCQVVESKLTIQRAFHADREEEASAQREQSSRWRGAALPLVLCPRPLRFLVSDCSRSDRWSVERIFLAIGFCCQTLWAPNGCLPSAWVD